jgi:hypothetical protein
MIVHPIPTFPRSVLILTTCTGLLAEIRVVVPAALSGTGINFQETRTIASLLAILATGDVDPILDPGQPSEP